MADMTEIEALKASMRGARSTAQRLSDLSLRVESLDPRAEIPDADLEELQRQTLAHAVAAQALRGLVETMLKRRGKVAEAAIEAGGIEE
jgi:hypothetical protein